LVESDDDPEGPPHRGRRLAELLLPLGVHALFLIVYTLIFWVLGFLLVEPITLDSPSPSVDVEFAAGMWLLGVVAPLWLIVAALLIWWWRQHRRELVKRTVAWDSLLWLGLQAGGHFTFVRFRLAVSRRE
jgi:hypothetical protein